MKFLQNEIKTKKDIAYYIADLYDNNMMYHFEDDPIDVININDEAVFTPHECDLLNKRVDEICKLNMLEDAFNFARKHLESEDDMHVQAWREPLTQKQINTI
jgi:hypothetical protein